MFAALEEAGIEIFIWNPARPMSLVPWRNYKPMRQISVRLKKSELRRILRIAKKQKRSKYEVMREMLRRGLQAIQARS